MSYIRMSQTAKYQNRIELLQGTLDMLVLQALQHEPMHGYAIAQVIRNRSGEVLTVETGSLYPALHRLERQKWVKSEWKLTESKQRAKYYKLTALGKKQLTADHQRWLQFVRAIGAVMETGVQAVMPWRWDRAKESLSEELESHLKWRSRSALLAEKSRHRPAPLLCVSSATCH